MLHLLEKGANAALVINSDSVTEVTVTEDYEQVEKSPHKVTLFYDELRGSEVV